jgi:hypothetical protein
VIIMQLVEESLRRPVWDEARGHWITLGDGQRWLLPKPIVSLRPSMAANGYAGPVNASMLGAKFEEVRAAMFGLESDDYLGFTEAAMHLGVIMLGFHYDLADDAYGDLLDTGMLPDGALIDIVRVATGRAPKPSPAESGS